MDTKINSGVNKTTNKFMMRRITQRKSIFIATANKH